MAEAERRPRFRLFSQLRGGPFSVELVEIALKVPPLFVMDTILLNNMGINSGISVIDTEHRLHSGNITNITEEIRNSKDLYQTFSNIYGGNPAFTILPYVAKFLISLSLYFFSVLVFFLQLPPLIFFYLNLVGFLTLPASYFGHKCLAEYLQGRNMFGDLIELSFQSDSTSEFIPYTYRAIVLNYIYQYFLTTLLLTLLRVDGGWVEKLKPYLGLCMVAPCAFASVSIPTRHMEYAAFFSIMIPGIVVVASWAQQASNVASLMRGMFQHQRDYVNNFGIYAYLEAEWLRLRVPDVLRMFWLTRTALVLLSAGSDIGLTLWGLYSGLKLVLVRGSETLVSLLAMTSVISSVSHAIGVVFQTILHAEDDEEKSVASVSAILFFVLALQTGMTGLDSEKRFQQMCKNLCLLLTAILHFVHTMVQPVLHSLSASRINRRDRHLRALGICGFLCVFPMVLMYVLWNNFQLGTWLLAVSAFCVEVIVKALVTVIIYALFMWDVYFQNGVWESLDDWVYYIRSFGNTVEFCFAVFLFFNGGWILVFESGGTIRAVMMLIHAYFNIWCEAKAGWSTFIKRRTAVAKINSLQDATTEDIQKHADVCAICYQDMTNAKLTRCNHMFHAICLRKWLYMQDSCPMCHKLLHKIDATSQTEDEGARPMDEADAQNQPEEIPPLDTDDDDIDEGTEVDDSDDSEDYDEDAIFAQ